MIKTYEGNFAIGDEKIGIVVSRFNGFITENLLAGAIDALKRQGVEESQICIVKVPGAFEIPQVVRRMIAQKFVEGIICLGCVIRGATPHFDYVAGECAKGVSNLALKADIPISFGVLTTETIEQAIERAGTKAGNKGADAALSLIEMMSLYKHIN